MSLHRCALVAFMVVASAACARQTKLEPALAATTLGPDTAFASAENVSVSAEVDAWEGDSEVLDYVTPMRVTVKNEGDTPIRVRYESFDLRGRDGSRYRALPPFQIRGSITKTTPVGFAHRGFWVDPVYDGYYNGLYAHRYGYPYDYGYYDTYYNDWEQNLPTPRMLMQALPEGVLEPGGMVEGFLYFQKIDEDVDRVWLHADLVGAQAQEQLGSLEIPFNVERG